jgi:hypothetical protein
VRAAGIAVKFSMTKGYVCFAAAVLLAAMTAGSPARAQQPEDPPDDGEIPEQPLPEPPKVSPYAFSDELGGFSITSVSGIGTRQNPVLIVQQFSSATPVTMVVRAIRPVNPFGLQGDYATGTIHVVLDITNVSGVPWIGLELELQEHYTTPSVYGDGLSFDQRRQEKRSAFSSAFDDVRNDFEPYDRLLYGDGALNHRARASFRFIVTDVTPVPTFYIRLDPRIPAS